ncbi:hypothetical protein U1Q18_051644 [Sarracenia purpurea var. burkii]
MDAVVHLCRALLERFAPGGTGGTGALHFAGGSASVLTLVPAPWQGRLSISPVPERDPNNTYRPMDALCYLCLARAGWTATPWTPLPPSDQTTLTFTSAKGGLPWSCDSRVPTRRPLANSQTRQDDTQPILFSPLWNARFLPGSSSRRELAFDLSGAPVVNRGTGAETYIVFPSYRLAASVATSLKGYVMAPVPTANQVILDGNPVTRQQRAHVCSQHRVLQVDLLRCHRCGGLSQRVGSRHQRHSAFVWRALYD